MTKTERKLWFKRKHYGWGWYPVSWEGWLVVLVFIVLLLINGFYFSFNASSGTPSLFNIIIFLIIIIISIIVMFWICYKKGEKPRWSWGS